MIFIIIPRGRTNKIQAPSLFLNQVTEYTYLKLTAQKLHTTEGYRNSVG